MADPGSTSTGRPASSNQEYPDVGGRRARRRRPGASLELSRASTSVASTQSCAMPTAELEATGDARRDGAGVVIDL